MAAGDVTVTASISQDADHLADTETTDPITINALQSPSLSLTASADTLEVEETHTFEATTAGNTAITWSVSDTALASIDDGTGELTAMAAGSVEVIATVAADDTYSGATLSHTLTITHLPARLTFTITPVRLLINQMTQFNAIREGEGALIWSIVEDTAAATINSDTGRVTAGTTTETVTVQVMVAETPTHASETVTASLEVIGMADADTDGLIEIHDLTMLHNMRFNLAGTSYKNSGSATGVTSGCPAGTCSGYELVGDLDFDRDGDGTTWSGDSTNGYTLDTGDTQATYFDTANGGWEPIGDASGTFTAILEGNGHVIRNLAIRRDQDFTGLFGDMHGTIRNLGLEDALADYTGNSGNERHIGVLVGRMVGATLIASHASGVADGGTGDDDNVGGLVGQSWGSAITASYANVTALGGDGDIDKVGGLVGENGGGGTIAASYAIGTANGQAGDNDSVGGLVGEQINGRLTANYATGTADGGDGVDFVGGLLGVQSGGTLTASYATGTAAGGDGSSDTVGGLVGWQDDGTLTASYATGTADGGDGNSDIVGGLVGEQSGGTLTASYATTTVNGGNGFNDSVGALVGNKNGGTLTASYGFGTPTGETVRDEATPPATTAAGLTAGTAAVDTTHAGDEWNQAASGTLSAWDFGDANQPPALLYNDYDGTPATDDIDYCARFLIADIPCGSLLPGQRTTTTPRSGINTDDIQLAEGDTADSVTANILLPATFTVGENTLDLMWSLHHDSATNPVALSGTGDTLLVDADSRATTRWIILRAMSGGLLVNDYRLRIIAGSGGLQNPGLRFAATVAVLARGNSHSFAATSDSSSAIGYSVTDADGNATALATINATTGRLTAVAVGTVKVTATVAADGSHRSATTSHTLVIREFPNLAFTATVNTLAVNATHSFVATSDSSGAISYRVTNTDGSATTFASIDDTSGVLTAIAVGTVRVLATVAADDTYGGDTIGHTLTVNRANPNLGFAPYSRSISRQDGAVTLIATTDSVGAITWSSSDDTVATIAATSDDRRATLTPVADGDVTVTAEITQTPAHASDTATTDTISVNNLTSPNLQISGTPPTTLDIGATHTFTATRRGTGAITWSVSDPARATIDPDSGMLTGVTGGPVDVIATVAADDTFSGATIVHMLTILHMPANLAFDGEQPARLPVGTGQTAQFSVTRDGGGAISWSIVGGSPMATIDENGLVTASDTEETITVQAAVATTPTHAGDPITTELQIADFADFDGDGLIDIHSLTMLHNMRFDMAGASYKTASDDPGNTTGCPDATPDDGAANENCTGYELMNDLDFDKDGDGRTWSGDSTNGYTLDAADAQAPYFPAGGGWAPIGGGDVFSATFEGNGFVIRNLAVRRGWQHIGLFGRTSGTIRNLGLENALADYTGNNSTPYFIGVLVALMDGGAIIASHSTAGAADAGNGGMDRVGGLVGQQGGGAITASHASGTAYSGNGIADAAGGLVGFLNGGTITASYASVAVGHGNGDGGLQGGLGGLVGDQNGGTIIASYATGTVTDGNGNRSRLGGLVGHQRGGSTIIASYATGDTHGGDGFDNMGGLVGEQNRNGPAVTITASYATGDVDGEGGNDRVGRLIGARINTNGNSAFASHGFGMISGERVEAHGASGLASAAALTATNAGGLWNAANRRTLNAWDFGDSNQPPALRYNDYDGTGRDNDIDYCALFVAANIPCGSLLPGQRAATTPQSSLETGDIQFAEGDTADSITANILLPSTLTVGGNTLDLMWSLHHDSADNPVTLNNDGDTLLVDADSRIVTRWIILRATTGMGADETIVNDYRLRILAGSEGLQNPGLRFTSTVDTLTPIDTHSFAATSDSSGAITYSVTDTSDAPTSLATIDSATGLLTASGAGVVKVTASVAADGTTYRGATTSHTLSIIRISAPLTITSAPDMNILGIGDSHTLIASTGQAGDTRSVTWSVTDLSDDPTSLATIGATTGLLTANAAGRVKVTASVAQDAAYNSDTVDLTVTIRTPANLTFTSSHPERIRPGSGQTVQFSVTREGTGAITWSIVENAAAATISDTGLVTAGTTGETITVKVAVAATPTHAPDTLTATLIIAVDFDEDGLIDINSLAMLHNIRHNLAGTSYKTGMDATGVTSGCPKDDSMREICFGYELMNDLDFDTDNDGTWSGNNVDGYTLDGDDDVDPYFDAASGGWLPIGGDRNPFTGTLEGNGFVIHNLAIRRNQEFGGLFGRLRGTIRNLGLEQALADSGGSNASYVAPLVGQMSGGTITASYATGTTANTAATSFGHMGGLVGSQSGGSIIASYANVTVTGGDNVGGLVGRQTDAPSIINSYATGDVTGETGSEHVGGLVGLQRNAGGVTITASYATGDVGGVALDMGGLVGVQRGTITASYATGDVTGGRGNQEDVGGLVGEQRGIINASYATGDVNNGGGNSNDVGGLVGEQNSPIRASYATGNVNGGGGTSGNVGGLVGFVSHGIILASYATGDVDGGGGIFDEVGGLAGILNNGSILASYATGDVYGGNGSTGRVGGLVGTQSNAITASYATGNVHGGGGGDDYAGGLVGLHFGGTTVASYATGDVNGGGQFGDIVGALSGEHTAGAEVRNYGFGTLTGGRDRSITPAPPATTAEGLTAANVGVGWNTSSRRTLGAWDFGDANQPPALRYNDYDDTAGIDYCDQLAAANARCGSLLPGQRADTSPQFGIVAGDIQLAQGDTASGVTANILLPASITVNGASLALTWSVHHDPEATDANKVTISSGVLQVNDTTRTSTRWIVLRATTGMGGDETIVNDYHLRIIEGSGTLQNPILRFTSTVDTLNPGSTHTFVATSDSGGAISYAVTDVDGNATTFATINPTTGLFSATAGTVRVIATVAATGTYRASTIIHTVSIPRQPANLVFSDPPARMSINQTARFSVTQEGTGEITWSIVEGTAAATIDSMTGVVTAGTTGETITVQAAVAESTSHLAQVITTTLIIAVDFDEDGLIEIYDLTMLHNMRHNLAGTSYKAAAAATGDTTGCPNTGCNGYELMNDLDLDRDGNGRTWNSDGANGYTLDAADAQATYFPAGSGWAPIGDDSNPFTATFDGNGHVIRNLAIRRDQRYIGLFGHIDNATIRNLGLEQALADYTGVSGSDAQPVYIAPLAGYMAVGEITASYATGTADGSRDNNRGTEGNNEHVGGLVGHQQAGTIAASYAATTVNGRGGDNDRVGGLVGHQQAGTIAASYATGTAEGGNGSQEVGGLLGRQEGGTLIASYATGRVDGWGGDGDAVGGLVGHQQAGTIAASYATGAADGGAGDRDTVGGLVGRQAGGTLTASYATGTANGEIGTDDVVGGLVGQKTGGTLTASYGFGSLSNGTVRSEATPPATTAAGLTAGTSSNGSTNAGDEWNQATSGTLGAWDFGDANQLPALLYNDYDGTGSGTDYCALFVAANIPCNNLLPDQRTTTTPMFGIEAGDIQLAEGDAANGVTANILLPSAFTVDGTSLDLTWSVHHDPEANVANQVTISSGTLQVTDTTRASTRWITLRARTGTTTVNDYRLRIIAGSGGLQNPGLRFTDTVDSLSQSSTHTFVATSLSSGAISYSVTDTHGNDTTLATMNAMTGALDATVSGTVKVIATVAANGTYRGATISHTVNIPALPAALAFTNPVDTQGVGTLHSFAATHLSTSTAVYRVTNTDGSNTDRASIDSVSGLLSATALGTVRVIASIAGDDTYQGATISHTLNIINSANLQLTASPARLLPNQTAQFSATRDGTGAITWSIVEGTAAATISGNGLVTATSTPETITVQVAVAATPTHAAATLTTVLEIAGFADLDGDGLIEIHDLTMLHNMRHNLAGTSYKDANDGAIRCHPRVAPTDTCSGYELMNDLDFDLNGDDRTWNSTTLALESSDSQTPYFDTANGGWLPIGDEQQLSSPPPLRATAL